MFVAIPRKRCDLFEIQTQCCFHQEMFWDIFFVRENITHRPQLWLPHQGSQNLQQKVGTESFLDLSLLSCNFSKNVSAWPTASLLIFDWKASFLAATSKLFSQCLSSYAFGTSFQIFPSANNISYIWHCKIQQMRFPAETICFLKKGMAVLPITCTRALQNHGLFDIQYFCTTEVQESLMQPFYTLNLIQVNVGNFSKQEKKSRYSHRDRGNFFTKSMCKLWGECFNNRLNWRLLKVW